MRHISHEPDPEATERRWWPLVYCYLFVMVVLLVYIAGKVWQLFT